MFGFNETRFNFGAFRISEFGQFVDPDTGNTYDSRNIDELMYFSAGYMTINQTDGSNIRTNLDVHKCTVEEYRELVESGGRNLGLYEDGKSFRENYYCMNSSNVNF